MWYNLCHIDGNPSTNVQREFTAAAYACPTVKCVTGNYSTECDYGIQTDCGTRGTLDGYLCGRGFRGEKLKAVGIGELPTVGRLA
jgi:hypothetical protein